MIKFIRCPGCGLRVRLKNTECPYYCACGRFISADGIELAPPSVGTKLSPCVYIGQEIRRVLGDRCGKRCEIKIFACSVYSECTLGQPVKDLACCARGACPSYRAAT